MLRPHLKKDRRLNLLRNLLCGLLVSLASGLSAPAAAQAPQPPSITGDNVAAYMNGFIPAAMNKADMAGAVIVVVKDGRIIFGRGYGYADIANRVQVDPTRTLFRIASVSKLFVWTAVMQQVERGKINLDADINTYLDFKIPPAFGKPITMRHLMTHSAGFEDQFKGMFFRTPDRLLPLAEAARKRMPKRIFPPGKIIAYSNYGATLAGYIVQRVSGEPFETYAQRHIFEPLGMRQTSFVQPLPPHLRARLAKAYYTRSGPAREMDYLQPWPGGSAASTGTDMARFMIAHLDEGRFRNLSILRPETIALMHRRASSIAPGTDLNSWTLGFWEEARNGTRVISHAGNLSSFHPYLHLIPSARTGIFVGLNSSGTGNNISFRLALFRGFMDRFFPPAPTTGAPPAVRANIDNLAGHYLPSRRSESSFLRIGNLWDQAVLTTRSDGMMEVSALHDVEGAIIRWRPVGPDLWQQVDGPSRLAVVRDRGEILYLATDELPPTMVFQPVSWIEDGRYMLPLFWALLAILAACFLFSVGRMLLVRSSDRRAALTLAATCLANFIFLGAWPLLIKNLPDAVFNEDMDIWLRLLQVLGVAGALGTLYLLWALLAKRRSPSSLAGRAGYALVLAANLCVLAIGIAFHFFAPAIGY